MKRVTLPIVILFLCALCVQAQKTEPAKPAATPAKSSYAEMLEKVKKGDLTVDFKALRFAFADTDGSYDDLDLSAKMNTALAEKNYKEALKAAKEQLEESYVNINGHVVAFSAYKEQGKTAEAEVHYKIATALIDSIIKNGDGRTTKTAWSVIDVAEEYIILSVLGYRRGSQSLIREDGHAYDLLQVVDKKTEQSAKLYFNVDKVFEGYTKLFKKN